jgi:hypothetical protein
MQDEKRLYVQSQQSPAASVAMPPPPPRALPAQDDRDNPTDGRRRRSASTKAQEGYHGDVEEFVENEHELFCVCQQPFNVDTAMIECDLCNEWYHLKCVGLTQVHHSSLPAFLSHIDIDAVD